MTARLRCHFFRSRAAIELGISLPAGAFFDAAEAVNLDVRFGRTASMPLCLFKLCSWPAAEGQ